MSTWARTRTPSRSRSTSSSSSSLPTNDVMSILGVAIVPPHLTLLTHLSMRMAVAIYVTGISTPEVHPEFPPLLGTLTMLLNTAHRWCRDFVYPSGSWSRRCLDGDGSSGVVREI